MESLYTKYRPQTFEQVVGQKHVVGTLKRAVLEGESCLPVLRAQRNRQDNHGSSVGKSIALS